MKITLKTIPHNEQRYETVGDYFEENGETTILCSELKDERYEFLVLIHELVESFICKQRGISEPDIMAFDIEFEKNRKEGDESEPGDDINAPYRKEHFFATNIEWAVAHELGVDWAEYERTLIELFD